MKFKTKYNIGDIVEFRRINMDKNKVGSITGITIRYSLEKGHRDVCYDIDIFELNKPIYISTKENIYEYDIENKLNSKAFLKRYAELVAEQIVKGDNQQ